jgi:prepilin peptidase CpaA
MNSFVLAPAIGVLGWAAYGDAKRRRIPNQVSQGVAALAVLRLILEGDAGAAIRTVGVAAIVLAVSFLLFARGVFGGGDAKLISGAALLVGSTGVLDFLLLTSIIGALLVPVVVIAARFGPSAAGMAGSTEELQADNAQKSASPQRPTIPYGVAIAVACAVILVFQSLAK